MATKPSTHEPSLSPDDRREQELYTYFNPITRESITSPFRAPNSIVASQAQLLSYRLDTARACVTLADKQHHYFVAEATKNMHLDDCTDSTHGMQTFWSGGKVTALDSRPLCTATLQVTPPIEGGTAYIEHCDFSQDPVAMELPVYKNEGMRYYCGVPLRTRKGINIGTLCCLDDRPREPIGEEDLQCQLILTSWTECA